MTSRSLLPLFVVAVCPFSVLLADEPQAPQYESGTIRVPAAGVDEPLRLQVSSEQALNYLQQGADAWTREKACISCHTNGSYLAIRPQLTRAFGPPSQEIRDFFDQQLAAMQGEPRADLKQGIRPTQVAYLAWGLAEWDRHVSGKQSPESIQALRLMFDVQAADGSWGNADCWPPLESSAYHGATVAAMALAAAPEGLQTFRATAGCRKLFRYLREQPPPHDYARVLLLWSAVRIPELLSDQQRAELIERIWKLQRDDGGWSLRSFATPETWGRGNRAEKLRAEPDNDNPASDGHQTGLCTLVLLEAGLPVSDPRLQKAVRWLASHQRESGRWWTRSLNTDQYHFITYSGTCYALAALERAGALGESRQTVSGSE